MGVTGRHDGAPTILLVEDEHFIRLATYDVLGDQGWTIIEADRASAAMAVLDSGEPIDLVFSDIQMPGEMDGIGLAQWLRRHHPAIPVLLTSAGVASVDPSLCDSPVISKPYCHDKLIERIRQHLQPTHSRHPRSGDPSAAANPRSL